MGPPGTGKTLLAKAIAGEADVAFFNLSASEFVEMFVGVGASRVRDLFAQAKKSQPSIIFIDEIDAVGRHRGGGIGGGHDEREQTLNQLLVELDGFDEKSSVIVMAATNRPDILDQALLRPGRFDRQVVIDKPDIKGRLEILEIHKKGKKIARNVDMNVIAKRTAGFTGADLANLVNEGALLAARRNRKTISLSELEASIDRIIAGPEKKSKVMTDKEKKISQIKILMGGRSAEELFFDEITTGATNDIKRATSIARAIICEYGMSPLGARIFGRKQENIFLGKELQDHTKDYSEETAKAIDGELTTIINSCYEEATKIIKANKKKLDKIVEILLEKEVLDGSEFEKLLAAKA